MMVIKKLSESEKKLLFIFVTFLILVCSYRFGFLKYTNMADSLNQKNVELTNRLSELQQKQAKKDMIISQTEEKNEEIIRMLQVFPANITPEKSTIFVTNLENEADMEVSAVAFQDMIQFYSSSGTTDSGAATTDSTTTGNTAADGTTMSNTTADGTTTSNTAADGATTDNATSNSTEANTNTDSTNEKTDQPIDITNTNINMNGYQTSMDLTFQTNYKGLKKAIEYINSYEEKMNISEMSVAFDNTTGNLTGTMKINLYAVDGLNKNDQEPDIDGIDIGTDNIFGTFETPVKDATNKK